MGLGLSERRLRAEDRGQRRVMGSSSAGQRAGYSDHGVPGSLVGAGVVEPRGFLQMDWSQCAS
jgi:hypothetical protein